MSLFLPYICFPGHCQEALGFYQECLGGEIVFTQTYGDSPLDTPDGYQDKIFNSEFQSDHIRLRASDTLPPFEVTIGSNICLFAEFKERSDVEQAFERLSKGGEVIMPLDSHFGMVADPYQIRWMLVWSGN